jgi:hypothetical protein
MIVLFLSGMVAMIMMRTLHRDFNRRAHRLNMHTLAPYARIFHASNHHANFLVGLN